MEHISLMGFKSAVFTVLQISWAEFRVQPGECILILCHRLITFPSV